MNVQDIRPQCGKRDFGRGRSGGWLDIRRRARGSPVVADPRGQIAAPDLAAVGARQFIDEPDASRRAIRAERLARVLEHRVGGDAGSRLEHDGRNDLLAEPWMRNAERRRVGDSRDCAQNRIDFERRDLVAAAIDDLLDAADEVQLAGAVEAREIAHPEPTIDEIRGIEIRVVEIPVDDLRPAYLYLADFAAPGDAVAVVHEANVAAHRRPDRAARARGGRQSLLRNVSRFARREPGDHGHAQQSLQPVHFFRLEAPGRHTHKAQSAGIDAPAVGQAREQLAQDRERRRRPGRAARGDRGEKGLRIADRQDVYRAAVEDALKEGVAHPARQVERHQVPRDIARTQSEPLAGRARRRHDLPVPMGDDLGPAGRARRRSDARPVLASAARTVERSGRTVEHKIEGARHRAPASIGRDFGEVELARRAHDRRIATGRHDDRLRSQAGQEVAQHVEGRGRIQWSDRRRPREHGERDGSFGPLPVRPDDDIAAADAPARELRGRPVNVFRERRKRQRLAPRREDRGRCG